MYLLFFIFFFVSFSCVSLSDGIPAVVEWWLRCPAGGKVVFHTSDAALHCALRRRRFSTCPIERNPSDAAVREKRCLSCGYVCVHRALHSNSKSAVEKKERKKKENERKRERETNNLHHELFMRRTSIERAFIFLVSFNLAAECGRPFSYFLILLYFILL